MALGTKSSLSLVFGCTGWAPAAPLSSLKVRGKHSCHHPLFLLGDAGMQGTLSALCKKILFLKAAFLWTLSHPLTPSLCRRGAWIVNVMFGCLCPGGFGGSGLSSSPWYRTPLISELQSWLPIQQLNYIDFTVMSKQVDPFVRVSAVERGGLPLSWWRLTP